MRSDSAHVVCKKKYNMLRNRLLLTAAILLVCITCYTQNVGIGISNPQNLLQIHAASGSAFTQYTVTNSGSGATDGLLVGIDGTQQAFIRQRENLPLFFYTNDQLQMRLTQLGRLGIGVSTPARVLDVGGAGIQYSRITSTSGATTGIEFVREGAGQDWRWTNAGGFFDLYNVTNDFTTSNTSDIVATFTNSGRLGIGTISPVTELHIVGTIRNSELAGSGTRRVQANGSGDLIPGGLLSETKYWIVNGYAFNSTSSTFNYGSIAYNTSGVAALWAPVNLPDGATVTNVYINYGDISTISDLRVRMLKVDNPGNFIVATMAELESTGTPGASSPQLTDFSITDPIIDNFESTYLIEVAPAPGDTWDFNRINIRNVRIAYTLPY